MLVILVVLARSKEHLLHLLAHFVSHVMTVQVCWVSKHVWHSIVLLILLLFPRDIDLKLIQEGLIGVGCLSHLLLYMLHVLHIHRLVEFLCVEVVLTRVVI